MVENTAAHTYMRACILSHVYIHIIAQLFALVQCIAHGIIALVIVSEYLYMSLFQAVVK